MRAITFCSTLLTVLFMHVGASAQGGPMQGQGPMSGRGLYGSNYTAGWALMTTEERAEHRKQMRAAKTYDECRKVMDDHHKLMDERAKEKGAAAPLPRPRRDSCQELPR